MCGGLHGTVENGLVDVAKAESQRGKGIQNVSRHPTGMADLDYEWVFLKACLQSPEVLPVLLFVLEGPWELDENCA
jgi:hypothetical protein